MPWDAVFLAAAEDMSFWTERVKDVCLLYKANLKPRATLTDEGHHVTIGGQGNGSRGIPKGGQGNGDAPQDPPTRKRRPRGRGNGDGGSRNARGRKEDEQPVIMAPPAGDRGGKGAGKAAGKGLPRHEQECYKWTRDRQGCAKKCPDGRRHDPCPQCNKLHPHAKPCPK